MTKEDFVAKLAQAGKITKSQADGIFSAFVDMVAASIKKGERVALPGLGVFDYFPDLFRQSFLDCVVTNFLDISLELVGVNDVLDLYQCFSSSRNSSFGFTL